MAESLGLFPEAFVDMPDLIKLGGRLVLDLVITAIIVLGVYVRRYGRTEYVFTYFMFNAITFALCFLLRKVPVDLGFALGLFAVFGILRYRTEAIRSRDLTYLFVVIGVAILNAVVNKKVSAGELLLVNGVIVGLTVLLESSDAFRRDERRSVLYDDLPKLQPGQREALLEDLRGRTGLPVSRVDVEQVDLLRDTARLTVFYRAET